MHCLEGSTTISNCICDFSYTARLYHIATESTSQPFLGLCISHIYISAYSAPTKSRSVFAHYTSSTHYLQISIFHLAEMRRNAIRLVVIDMDTINSYFPMQRSKSTSNYLKKCDFVSRSHIGHDHTHAVTHSRHT